MAEVHLKRNIERGISDAAIEYARRILEEEGDDKSGNASPTSPNH